MPLMFSAGHSGKHGLFVCAENTEHTTHSFKKILKILITLLKVTFHLQLLQNIGYSPHVV